MKNFQHRYICLLLTMLLSVSELAAQSSLPESVCNDICVAIRNITLTEVAGSHVKVESSRIRTRNRKTTIEINASAELAYYPMRKESIDLIYSEVRKVLPERYRSATLQIYVKGRTIEELIPQYYGNQGKHFTNTSTYPLIERSSHLSQPSRGLRHRHIALWQSHGRYFKQTAEEWSWQRSRLWETVEDLYTQSYVVPYLLPMLERAGATVLLPRERSMTPEELILDNDEGIGHTIYEEHARRGKWRDVEAGFAHLKEYYMQGENPFEAGTARKIEATTDKRNLAWATWGGEIPRSGVYTLYISYATLHNSIPDAEYTVHTGSTDHTFHVNQQMGDGMWIPLGEFYFEQGTHKRLVTLSNRSSHSGVVTADAIKIGGGMGNIARGATPEEAITSHYPRFTEGARYWLQWSGFEEEIYSPKQGTDDYKEDYMSRAHWVNALMGGSERLPRERGKAIPIDLALAFHSDAGVRLNDEVIGTLGIYSTAEERGEFKDDISRLRSRDLTDMVMSSITHDIRALHEPQWTRRGMWDRAYYEARIPHCPTMLLELLSHQNFADMRYGLDPTFRFDVARAIYKGILRYLASQYEVEYVVQPLPVHSFAIELEGNTAHLSWQPTLDALEPTATPDYYILYRRMNGGDFDGGERIDTTHISLKLDPGKIYSYRITAVNEGGESFCSESLSVCCAQRARGTVMVVNGFDRVSAPYSFAGDSLAGFYNRFDSGVPYIEDISFIGEQTIFDRGLSKEENDNYALGSSYNDYEQEIIAGNTFDYPLLHGRAIVEAGYSFTSTSHRAVSEGEILLDKYDVVGIILGKQRTTTIGRGAMGYRFEAMPEALQQQLRSYTEGGGSLLVSGSYLHYDLWHGATATEEDRTFAREVLHTSFGGTMATRRGEAFTTKSTVTKRDMKLHFQTMPSRDIYHVEAPEVVTPYGEGATTIMRYSATSTSAAVAYDGTYRTIVIGFPFETIPSEKERNTLMKQALNYLNEK